MAKASIPIGLQSKHLTKAEIEARKEAEEKLKGIDDQVYKPPKHLTKEEKKLYKELVNELKASGILCNLDINILEQTIDSILKMRQAKALINQHGILITNSKGDLVKNPACTAYKEYNAIYAKCCMELALSPSSRAKLALANIKEKQNEEDPLLKALRE